MIINGIDCGDEFELSCEEFAVLLELVRERQSLNAERARRRIARAKADAMPDAEIIGASKYFIEGRLQHPFFSAGCDIADFLQDARKKMSHGDSW